MLAASVSFLVAASWNYWWNRYWTFREQRGHFGYQGMRFFTVAAVVYGAFFIVLVNAVVDIAYAWLDPRIRPT